MSRSPSREDKTCLNCHHVAEKRFCPNCGQENVETRKTFHLLFVHFFEDLTHYENAFWKTIRNLIFRPAALTKEYLSGKRMSYLAPFRLYIFISFVTFFFIAVVPQKDENKIVQIEQTEVKVPENADKKSRDSITKAHEMFDLMGYKSAAHLDSLQKFGPAEDKLPKPVYWVVKKMIVVVEKNTTDELIDKFQASFVRNLPKVLFIYLPIFALVLWLFQSKRKYYYYDHGIFTLHYFSFLLIMYFLLTVIETILSPISDNSGVGFVLGVIRFVGIVYMLYYFFPAHHRFYGETRIMTIIKGSVMFIINLFFIMLILVLFAIYTFITIH